MGCAAVLATEKTTQRAAVFMTNVTPGLTIHDCRIWDEITFYCQSNLDRICDTDAIYHSLLLLHSTHLFIINIMYVATSQSISIWNAGYVWMMPIWNVVDWCAGMKTVFLRTSSAEGVQKNRAHAYSGRDRWPELPLQYSKDPGSARRSDCFTIGASPLGQHQRPCSYWTFTVFTLLQKKTYEWYWTQVITHRIELTSRQL